MKITLYLSHERDGSLKDRERIFGEALRDGFVKHGDTVAIAATHEFTEPDWSSSLAVVIGIKGHSKRIFEEYRRGGRHVMLVDKSYLGRGEYVRLSIGGFQPPYLHATPMPHDRWEKISRKCKIVVHPRRSGGQYLIYAGSSQKYCDWHGLGDVSEFADTVCWRARKNSRGLLKAQEPMRVLYRPKPSWAAGHPDEVKEVAGTEFSGPGVKLAQLLPGCHALITHGSNAAVEAVIAGVPAIVISQKACAAQLVAERKIENVREPFFPDDAMRLQWLADLSYSQFNLAELTNGTAWDILSSHTDKAALATLDNLSPDESLIAQYRMMHQQGMYRGNMRGQVAGIAELIAKYQPQSILDYGSGEGRQYDELNVHETWGGLKPVCYDPGCEALSRKPDGKFDFVICTDVAEHIPEEGLDAFLVDVIGCARKAVFFCIFTEPSRKFLPDGRNCHLTAMPRGWWVDRLCTAIGGRATSSLMAADMKCHLIEAPGKPDIIVTFRGKD